MDGGSQEIIGRKRHRSSTEDARKALGDNGDRISCLPESLLLHILSFLEMPDVVRTCLLSTRWRYLWVYTPCLDFEISDSSGISDKGNFIDRSLFHHEGSKVEILLIYILYKDTLARQIDSWIRFALRHNVEDFTLDLFNNEYPESEWWDTHYKLPHSLFNCGSLRKLVLSFCDLNLPYSMHLCSLKKLELQHLDISGDQIAHLTSCCPLLEDLCFHGCNRFEDLNIIIPNPNLKNLQIYEYTGVEYDSKIMISAPNLCHLYFNWCLPREKYEFKNLSSLVTAKFYDLYKQEYHDKELTEGDGYEWARLLGDLHCVKELEFCVYFIQVISVWEVEKLRSFPINAARIKLATSLSKFELPGIFYLLKNSTKLEALTLYSVAAEDVMLSKNIKEKFDFDEIQYLESKEAEASSMLQNLKTITFDFGTIALDMEDIEFVKFLLRNSKALEKMTVNIGKNSPSFGDNYKELCIFMDKLLAIPRASTDCEVYVI
ncbi:hypothetical protein ACHQM5_019773 [Ranunculus cassubicifolius]